MPDNPFDFTDPSPGPNEPRRTRTEPPRPRRQERDEPRRRSLAKQKLPAWILPVSIGGAVVGGGLLLLCLVSVVLSSGRSSGNNGGDGGSGTSDSPVQALKNAQKKDIVFSDVIDAEFAANEAAADLKYKGKFVVLEGRVEKVEKDLTDAYFIGLNGKDSASFVKCRVTKSQFNELTTLRVGDRVRVRGRCAGVSFYLRLEDCVFTKIGL